VTTKTIGSASRNYATLALWESYLQGIGTLVAQEIGETYNDANNGGAGVQEFTENVGFSGFTPGSGTECVLRPATGQGFRDNPSAALRYNVSNGVAWRSANSFSGTGWGIGVDYMTVKGMQMNGRSSYVAGFSIANGKSHSTVDSCILMASGGGIDVTVATGGVFVNCLLVQNQSSGDGAHVNDFTGPCSMYGCTIARPTDFSAAGKGINEPYSRLVNLKNTAIFGFTSSFGTTNPSGTTSYGASDTTFPAGTNMQPSLTYGSQFENTAIATGDWKAKASGSLKNGTPDATFTPVDIFGTTRDASTPYIGCYEVAGGGGGGGTDVLMGQAWL
jgi:hypothetical protein